jgi:hypothetical protein
MKRLFVGLKTTGVVLGATLCLTASEDRVFAQAGRSIPTPVERREEQMNRQSADYERDSLDRDLKGRSDKPGDHRRNKVVANRIEQDFEGLQAGYNQIVLAMASKKDTNDVSILKAVAEIKKCAARLKDDLALPKPDDNDRKEVPSGTISETMGPLLLLRKHIYSFVTNPLFESSTALDVRQAKKASHDLDQIIQLSESLKREGDKLKKAH